MEKENYNAPEQDTDDVDAPELESQNGDDGDADDAAYREFLSDRRAIRFEDTADNRRELFDYLLSFSPPLPESPAALLLAYEQLSEAGKLELLSPGRERTPDEKTEGELQAEKQKRAEPERTSDEIAEDARATLERFKRQNRPMLRHKNGVLVS